MFLLNKNKSKTSSQAQIAIEGVRDGTLLLPKHSYAQVLHVSSINFELMSEEEQDVLIDSFQGFLNSIASPFQILVRVREMDMDRYLDSFKSKTASEQEPIYKEQAAHYITFVKQLISSNKILSRNFYVVAPLASQDKDFDVIASQLKLSVDMITRGLGRLGMHLRPLNSLEALDLFYSFYSPAQAKRHPLKAQTVKLLEGAVL